MKVASSPPMGVCMYFLKHRSIAYLGLAIFLMLAVVGTRTGALAALSESGPATVSATPVTLNGNDQTTTYSLALSVTNTGQGNGNGWRLTITSTTFSTSGGTHSLPNTASTINSAPTAVCNGGNCTLPTETGISYPFTIPAGSTPPTAQKFYNAAAGTGKGTMTITATVTVAINANTFAGSYTSTVSVVIASGL